MLLGVMTLSGGKNMVTLVPRPTSLVSSSLPPLDLHQKFGERQPQAGAFEAAVEAIVDLAKSLSAIGMSSAVIPMPVSLTVMVKPPSSDPASRRPIRPAA